MAGEVSADIVAHEKMLVGGEAERRTGGGGKLCATLSVALGGALHFGDAFANNGFCDDELRFPALAPLGPVEGLEDGGEIVPIDGLHIPRDRLEALRHTLALRLDRHRIEGDVVGVVNEDQVIEFLVAGERTRFHRDAFLHAPVTGESHDVIIK